MIRTLLLSASLFLGAGCAQRYDVNVAWTVGGFAPADVCPLLSAPSVRLRLDQQDSADGAVVEESFTAPCADGKHTVRSAAFSNMFVELLEDEAVYGTVGPIALAPGNAAGSYAGEDAGAPVRSNIEVQRGRLHARFTVVGKDCQAAGVSSFTATLRQNTAPQTEEIVAGQENVEVPCTGDVAILDYEPVEVGSLYDIVATATADGTTFTTENDGSGGAGAVVTGLVTNLIVDLDVESAAGGE